MAHEQLFRFRQAEPPVQQLKRAGQQRRNNLRIAIRQLERAELYLVSLYSLELSGEGVERTVDGIVRDVRGLREHLLRLKAAT
ncbi:MAG TPA: hypothetical protein VGE99_12575 [Candidatus Dormibacteraeota bacterium]